MKESSTSLRWFFGVIGIWYLFSAGFVTILFGNFGLGLSSLAAISGFYVVNLVVQTVFALADIYFAFALPRYLHPSKSGPVKIFLIAQFVWVLLGVAWNYLVGGGPDIVSLIVSALLTWYLFHNINKLSSAALVSTPQQ